MFMYIMHMCSTHINQKRHALERLLRRSQDNWMTICIVDEICCQQKHILRAIYAQPSMQQQNNRTLKRSNFDFLSFCWFVDALEILHAIYDFVGNKIGLPKPMHVVVFFLLYLTMCCQYNELQFWHSLASYTSFKHTQYSEKKKLWRLQCVCNVWCLHSLFNIGHIRLVLTVSN